MAAFIAGERGEAASPKRLAQRPFAPSRRSAARPSRDGSLHARLETKTLPPRPTRLRRTARRSGCSPRSPAAASPISSCRPAPSRTPSSTARSRKSGISSPAAASCGGGSATRRASSRSAPASALTIPLGTRFQFRATAAAPLAFVAVTMPPWPGDGRGVPRRRPLARHRPLI